MPTAQPRKRNGPVKAARLNLRATSKQDALIRKAAALLGRNVTEFVLDSACANAEQVLVDKRHFVLNDGAWTRFMAALDRPAIDRPRLRKLLTEPSVLNRS